MLEFWKRNPKIKWDAITIIIQGIINIPASPPSDLHKRHTWWPHQMETFPSYWPFVRGIHRCPVNSPHKGQWRGALIFSDLHLNKWLSKQSWGWWIETPLCSLWRHCNEIFALMHTLIIIEVKHNQGAATAASCGCHFVLDILNPHVCGRSYFKEMWKNKFAFLSFLATEMTLIL